MAEPSPTKIVSASPSRKRAVIRDDPLETDETQENVPFSVILENLQENGTNLSIKQSKVRLKTERTEESTEEITEETSFSEILTQLGQKCQSLLSPAKHSVIKVETSESSTKSIKTETTTSRKKIKSESPKTPSKRKSNEISPEVKTESKRRKKLKEEDTDNNSQTEEGKTKGRGRKSAKKEEEPEYKWWKDNASLPEGVKWRTLEHNGVLFPPPYQPHGVKLKYDGREVTLTPEQEEVATFYAQYLNTDHVKKSIFNQNFFKDFLAILNKDKKEKEKMHFISDFSKCDFSAIHTYLIEQKEMKKNWPKEKKDADKVEKDLLQEKYGWAIMDGHKQKMGNWKVEPPGLFLGRGDHPKAGRVKKRIMPSDVTINIGEEASVPECPIPGENWKAVVHDNKVTWLAYWKENINDQFKYVWLSANSRIKGESDMKKFETARKLSTLIDKIRERYMKELSDSDLVVRQRATALWLIDHLALRVGNEKGEDEADTVGCCSLRVEHVKLDPPNLLTLDFLGKDSMRFQKTLPVDTKIYQNIGKFMKNKSKEEDLFDALTTSALNNHLKEQMPDLTAKVFRTFNASFTLQKELDKTPLNLDVNELVYFYTQANREVAILCNHQRSLPKTYQEQMERIDCDLQHLMEHKNLLARRIKDLKAGKSVNAEEEFTLSTPKKKKPKKEEKTEETPKRKRKKKEEADEENGNNNNDDEEKEEDIKKIKLPMDIEKARKQLEKLNERIKKRELKKDEKESTKTVALGTSRINYLDPRITVAWCKTHNVPIERIFSKTLRAKFPWALDVEGDWKF